MHSIIESTFRCTFGSKWSEDVTLSQQFAVFSTWDVAHLWDDITVAADAFANGESVYQVAKEHGRGVLVEEDYVLGRRDESTRAPTGVDWTHHRRKGCKKCMLNVGP